MCYVKRNQVLTFQTPQTKGIISKLSEKNVSEWNIKDLKRLFNLYITNISESNVVDVLQKKSILHTDRSPKKRHTDSYYDQKCITSKEKMYIEPIGKLKLEVKPVHKSRNKTARGLSSKGMCLYFL